MFAQPSPEKRDSILIKKSNNNSVHEREEGKGAEFQAPRHLVNLTFCRIAVWSTHNRFSFFPFLELANLSAWHFIKCQLVNLAFHQMPIGQLGISSNSYLSIEQCLLDTNAGKTTVLSSNRCLFNTGVEKMNNI